jgi:hypothetical protein
VPHEKEKLGFMYGNKSTKYAKIYIFCIYIVCSPNMECKYEERSNGRNSTFIEYGLYQGINRQRDGKQYDISQYTTAGICIQKHEYIHVMYADTREHIQKYI